MPLFIRVFEVAWRLKTVPPSAQYPDFLIPYIRPRQEHFSVGQGNILISDLGKGTFGGPGQNFDK